MTGWSERARVAPAALAKTHGALGIAAALLSSLILVGRVMITSAELNAPLAERRR